MTETGTEAETDARTRRRAMIALFVGVAAKTTAIVGASTAATLIASEIGGAGWSGLPAAANVLGTATGSLLAGTLMARLGKRSALSLMYGLGALGGVIAFLAAVSGVLPLLLVGMVLLGIGNAGAQLARYVAADLYPLARKGFGLSVIVWAGTVGAIAGPALIAPGASVARWLGLPELSGPIAVTTVIVLLAVGATFVLPRGEAVAPVERKSPSMVLSALRRPAVLAPLSAMVAAHVAMVAVMTMTPVQLHDHGHGLDVVGWVIAAHMVGMFALAPLSGKIADRWGGRVTIYLGIGTLILAAVTCVTAPTAHATGLPLALFLLGYGWNLAFVGGSSLLARDLPEAERTRLQGTVDAVVWGSAAFASLSAGPLFAGGGYVLLAVVAGVAALAPLVVFARVRTL
ncbi:MFS transporter [Herbihabitans rhizosphaerae]|uniref:MFS transporter n=1 Tax=Herbihabitans rhizosphaerae TaxID=1872711 RepID=UPI001F5E827E|nr:MFS transporter [Herbihabitans rhizosphaerae]